MKRRYPNKDRRLGIQDVAVPGVEQAYYCNRCQAHYAGAGHAEDHLVYKHGVGREIAREAIVLSARG